MNDSGEDDDIDGTTVLDLIRLGAMLRRLLDRELMLEETGVSSTDTCILRLITSSESPCTSSTLAREFGFSRQAMRKMLLELEEREVVSIDRSHEHAPQQVQLGAEGGVLLRLGLANAQDLEQKLIGRADPEVRDTLRDLVSALLRRTRYRPWRFEVFNGLD